MDSYHHGNLRADLVSRARALVEGNSSEVPSLRELARQAGVSPTAVYHHFPSKEDLLAEVATQMLEDLVSSWHGLSLPSLGPAYLRYFRDHPSALGLLFGPRLRSVPRIRELQDQAYQALVGQLPPTPEGTADHRAGLLVWALVQGLAHLFSTGALGADAVECPGGPDLWYQEPEQVLETLAPLLDRMVRPGTPA